MKAPAHLETLIERSRTTFRLLSDTERQSSLEETLSRQPQNQDLWVFGYGSLVWRPSFPFSESRPALVRGYHRSLCLWSRVNRGTPERPGLVFGLDTGGSCKGLAYKLPTKNRLVTLQQLWQREMPSGAYEPKWLNCHTPDGPLTALTFIVNRSTPAYVRDLSDEHLLWIIQDACGKYGPCSEYVLETAQALKAANILDQKLDRLVRLMQKTTDRDAG